MFSDQLSVIGHQSEISHPLGHGHLVLVVKDWGHQAVGTALDRRCRAAKFWILTPDS